MSPEPSVKSISPTFRPLRAQDHERFLEIERATFTANQIHPAQLRRLSASSSVHTWVCEKDARVVGYVMVFTRRGAQSVRIYSLAVDAAERNQGLGSALLDQVSRFAASQGYERLSLEVRKLDVAAQRLYLRYGFQIREDLPRYYDDGADALRLSLPVPARAQSAAQ
jgi:ribosomal protein S18 acetylase RimI-like enzyme